MAYSLWIKYLSRDGIMINTRVNQTGNHYLLNGPIFHGYKTKGVGQTGTGKSSFNVHNTQVTRALVERSLQLPCDCQAYHGKIKLLLGPFLYGTL